MISYSIRLFNCYFRLLPSKAISQVHEFFRFGDTWDRGVPMSQNKEAMVDHITAADSKLGEFGDGEDPAIRQWSSQGGEPQLPAHRLTNVGLDISECRDSARALDGVVGEGHVHDPPLDDRRGVRQRVLERPNRFR